VLAECYLQWIKKVDLSLSRTKKTAGNLDFPYGEFRLGQRDMAAATYRVARDSGYLLCEAPTGVGKTISTLFPVVKSVADGHITKVAYLTAKTSGREVAIKSVDDMRAKGLEINYLVIQSKALICPCSNGMLERDAEGRCPFTLGFFDRLPSAREALFDLGSIDAQALTKIASEYQVCPFELSLQMLPWITVVICDYNYVFDPLVRLPAFSEPDKKRLLLLDESHNLIDRARGMYSAKLSRTQNQQVVKSCEASHPRIASTLRGLSRAMDRWAKCSEDVEWADPQPPKTITAAVVKCIESIGLEPADAATMPEGSFEWFKELFRYAVIEDLFAEHHHTITRSWRSGKTREIEIQLRCVNASDRLKQSFALYKAVVAFSATLRPLDYYHKGLGLPDDAQGMVLESPFDPSRLGVYVCSHVDTRYRQRLQSIDTLVELIHQVYSAKRGNYLVFFPSYAYLDQVYQSFVSAYPNLQVVRQQRENDTETRAQFLGSFQVPGATLGFAILGGVFGEGIDYEGDRLIGSVIVGTGLPSLSLEQKLISEDYAARGLDGFDFAFRYPGFTRVLQTAGRVIRGELDRGVVVLVDLRFSDTFYRKLYPTHWLVKPCRSHADLAQGLTHFWTESSIDI